MTPLYLAWTGCLLSLPVLTVCAALDRLLRTGDAVLRRRIWGTGLFAVSVLGAAALLPGRTGPGAEYFNAMEPTVDSLSLTIGHLVRTVSLPVDATAASDQPWNPYSVAGVIYLLVATLLLARLVAVQLLVARRLRRAMPVDDPGLMRRCRQLAEQVGLKRPVRLLWGAECASPAAFGFLRRGILLPADAPDWSAPQRDGVLLHELAHLRHHDCALRALATVYCAAQWFNPLAWLALRRLRDLCEMAADEAAARATGDAAGYATTLVVLARGLRGRQPALMGMADHALSRRIDHLLAHGPARVRRKTARLALATVVLSGCAVGAMAAMADGGTQLSGWPAQQIRWESTTTANGVFLHGEIKLQPGRLVVGREGLLLLIGEDDRGLETCVAWRDTGWRSRFECDTTADPQPRLDRRLTEAAPLWPRDSGSPLAPYWHDGATAAADRFAGSHITGIPGRSRNPDRRIIQAGWIGPDGARIGVFRRQAGFTVAFRYRPDTRDLRLVRQSGNDALVAWEGGNWRIASPKERNWFDATIVRLDAGR